MCFHSGPRANGGPFWERPDPERVSPRNSRPEEFPRNAAAERGASARFWTASEKSMKSDSREGKSDILKNLKRDREEGSRGRDCSRDINSPSLSLSLFVSWDIRRYFYVVTPRARFREEKMRRKPRGI